MSRCTYEGWRTDPDDTLADAMRAIKDHDRSQHECAVDRTAPPAATADHLSRHIRDARDPRPASHAKAPQLLVTSLNIPPSLADPPDHITQ